MSGLARLLGMAVIAVAVLTNGARAASAAPGEATVTGRIACAMCVLKLEGARTCTNVLVVAEGGKDVVYALADNPVTKAYEMSACEKAIPVKVTGTVAEKAGKRTITPSKIEKS
ncbi:MAG TPA: hypothetical protein VIW03_09265 [Anaeromyxobacter sp.]